MIDPAMLHIRQDYDIIDADTLDAINDDLEPGSGRRLRFAYRWVPALIVVTLTPLTLVYLFGVANVRGGLINGFFNIPGMWVPIMVAVIIPFFSARKARYRKLRSVMLRHERCTHCGYALNDLPADSVDQCTVCPECAGAWRLDESHSECDRNALRASISPAKG